MHLISLKNILKYLLKASSVSDTVSDSGETQMSSVDMGSVLQLLKPCLCLGVPKEPSLKLTDLIQGLEKKSDLAKGKPSWSSHSYLGVKCTW